MTMANEKNKLIINFKNRQEWREWLDENYDKEKEIWLMYYKKHTGKETILYNDAVEEALCFGWIDSLVKGIDKECYMQKYTPRKSNSVWSLLNKKRAKKMIAEGKMTSAGLEKIKEAEKNGKWDSAYSSRVRSKVEMPEDLKKELHKNETARNNFMSFSGSHQFIYIHWINSAKRSETREKRINEVIKRAELNVKPGIL